MSSIESSSSNFLVSRPVANFHPCRWGDHFLNLTPHEYHHDEATRVEKEKEVEKLKEEVKREVVVAISGDQKPPLEQLKLIDALERLGVAYHFENEIQEALQQIYDSCHHDDDDDDVYFVSIRFRILRQHGYPLSSDVFKKFLDGNGSFKESLKSDVEGMLSLYEACHVGVHGDIILDQALEFTTTHLKSMANNNNNNNNLNSPIIAQQVSHALNQPYHKGMTRLESRHYISVYEQNPLHNKTLLRFAKLDFNFLQSLHKMELRDLTRWWKGLHLKLPFSRDRSSEVYFWILGTYYEPQYSVARKIFSKLFKLVSLVDDMYDAYGTIDELELFTDAIQRWEKSCMDKFPDHVKWCYQAILETFEEVEQQLAQEGRSFCVHYAKEQMKILSKAYLQEAKWCHEKYIPTYDEYMEIGLVTSCGPYGIIASFLGMGEIATKEAFEWVCQKPMSKPIRASSTIYRLLNDMGGHKFEQSRNHVASSVQCLMGRHGAISEEDAHEALKNKVEDAWKNLNEAMLKPYAIPRPLLVRILNLTRVSNVTYKGEDGYTIVSEAMKERVAAVLVNPIPI